MAEALIRRTWPCGYQESINLKLGFWASAGLNATDDERPRPCPVHGASCHREP